MTIATSVRTAPFYKQDLPASRVQRLRPYQLAAGRAIADSAMNGRGLAFTVVMARQAGKNELSAQVEMLLLLRNSTGFLEGVKCAPTLEPQGNVSMRRLWSVLVDGGLGRISSRTSGRSIAVGGSRMVFLSAEPHSNVVGHTAELILEVDEAQDVDAEKFSREFRPMAAPSGATTVFYGTPWDDSTLLEQMVQRNLELQRKDGIQRHFEADWREVAAENPMYARFVESERERLGEDHPLFRTQYALKTVPGAGRLFSGSQRAQLQGTHGRQHGPVAGETYVAGLDIGGEGEGDHDATVLTIARVVEPSPLAVVKEPRLEVVEQVAMVGAPHDEAIGRVADLLGRTWGVRRVAVDATGIGEAVARLLDRALGGDVLAPVKFTSTSKSTLGYDLLAAVNGGRLRMYAPDGSAEYAECSRQVELARVAYRVGRQMSFYVDPSDGHDDYLVSLALAVAAGKSGIPAPRIARGRIALN
jgi:hypothetical protein